VIAAADIERAREADIASVLYAAGVRLKRHGRELIGPCPRCGGVDRFGVHLMKGVFNCRGCGARGDVIGLTQFLHGYDFADAIAALAGSTHLSISREPEPQPKTNQDAAAYQRQQARKAAWLWSRRQPTVCSPVERYLRVVRRYSGPIPPTLGFLPPTKPEHHPAMVACFAMVGEVEPGVLAEPPEVDAIHLTLLKPDGSGKAEVEKPKLCVGSPSGRPIWLAPPNDLLGLALTEGIEDGLTVYAATGLGVLATGSANLMPALADVVPSYIEAVTIYAHDDKSGRTGALALAERLHARGNIDVFIEGLP
jgi:hypothetical protein